MNKKELSQLYWLNREIEEQRRRLDELENISVSSTVSLTGVPSVRWTSDKVAKYAIEIADLKCLLDLNLKKCFYELNRLNRYIESVPDSQVRIILALRYINGMSWLQIANSIGGDNTSDGVRMIHNRFLEKK